MSIKFLVLGGGVFWVLGGECRFYFYGRADFSEINCLRNFFGSGSVANYQINSPEILLGKVGSQGEYLSVVAVDMDMDRHTKKTQQQLPTRNGNNQIIN